MDLNTPPSGQAKASSNDAASSDSAPSHPKSTDDPPTAEGIATSHPTTPLNTSSATSRKNRKKSRDGAIIIHDNPVSSPNMNKIMNVTPRQQHPLHNGDVEIDGERYALWKNYNDKSVVLVRDKNTVMEKMTSCPFPSDSENVAKLLHIMSTPNCKASPFKVEWAKHDGKFDGVDIILPCLKKEISFVEHHFDPRFGSNRVLSAYTSTELHEAVKLEDDGVISGVIDRQLCDHSVDSKGCQKKMLPSRASTKLVVYKEVSCAHHEEKRGCV